MGKLPANAMFLLLASYKTCINPELDKSRRGFSANHYYYVSLGILKLYAFEKRRLTSRDDGGKIYFYIEL